MKDILVGVCNLLLLSKLPARCAKTQKPGCGSRFGTAGLGPGHWCHNDRGGLAGSLNLFIKLRLVQDRVRGEVSGVFHFL